MKYCKNCGTQCEDADLICKACGSMLENTGTASEQAEPQATENRTYTQGYPGAADPSGGAGYSQAGNGNPGYYRYPHPTVNYTATPKTNGLAVASLVLGIIGLITIMCYGFGFIPAVLSIVFGAVSKGAIKNSGGTEAGRGMALAGLILGIVAIAVLVLLIILIILGAIALTSISASHFGIPSGATYSA